MTPTDACYGAVSQKNVLLWQLLKRNGSIGNADAAELAATRCEIVQRPSTIEKTSSMLR